MATSLIYKKLILVGTSLFLIGDNDRSGCAVYLIDFAHSAFDPINLTNANEWSREFRKSLGNLIDYIKGLK